MIQVVKKQAMKTGSIPLQSFALGLNTSVPPSMIHPAELSKCVDWKIKPGGKLETRDPVVVASSSAITGSVVSAATAVLDGVSYDLIAGSDGKIYHGLTPALIGTAETTPTLIPYSGACVVLDGGFLKYLDDTDGLKLAYDAGADGVQFNNIAGSQNFGIALNGTNTRAGVKFTTQEWTAGYTIPPTEMHAALKRTGSPTGEITFRIRAVSDDSILAEKVSYQDAGDIATAGEVVEVVFGADDVTTEFSPLTDCYAMVEFAGGDGSNYLELMCTDEAGQAQAYAGSYTEDATKNPVMKVYPGRPPKASSGVVSGTRLWIIDPDKPGGAKFCNKSIKDWSTTGFAGWVGFIDDDRNSFQAGALVDLYGTLFAFGTKEQPYLCRLEGTSPGDYSLPLMFQRAWANPRCIVNSTNDVWFGGDDGIDTLSGVQEYGDVRTFSESDPVADRLAAWDENSFAGYNPKDGTYMLYMGGRVLCANTKARVSHPDDGRSRYPWFEYDFPMTPTCFGKVSTGFVIGADDGMLYKFDPTEYKDLGTTQMEPVLRTIDVPKVCNLTPKFHIMGTSKTGALLEISIFKNGAMMNPAHTYDFSIPWQDNLTLDEAVMDLEDALFPIVGTTKPMWRKINMNVRSVMVEIKVTKLLGQPLHFNGLILEYRNIQS